MQQHGGFVQPGPLEGSKLTLPAQTLAGNDGSYRDQAKGIALGTGLSMSGGVLRAVGSAFDGAVATWADLPVGLEAPVVESVYLVRAGSGVWLLNRKKSGLYQRVAMTGDRAADWSYLGEWLEEFSDANFEVWHDDDTSRGLKFSLADQPTGTTVTVRSNDLETLGTMAAGWSGVSGHLLRTDNPHGVTAAQVGLGSVDNTRDADKPVSTAQAEALGARAPLVHGHASEDISDSTYVGRSLLTAASAAAQRNLIGVTPWATNQWTNGTTDDVPEGARLYFTAARANSCADARISAQKGQAGGLATLNAHGELDSTQVPAVSVVDFLGQVASEAAMLALAGEKGDWCTRTDLGTDWQIIGNDPTQAASWRQSMYPASPVQSVHGRNGAVWGQVGDYDMFYLLKTAQAADSAMLGGQPPAYYAQAGHVHNYAGSASTGGAATSAVVLDPLSGNADFKLAYTADGACIHPGGAYGRVVMLYAPNGETYGVRVDRADMLSDSGFYRITQPGGGTLLSWNESQTGAIAIQLPVGMVSTMCCVTVKVFDFAVGKSFEIHVCAYNYGEERSWRNPTAYVVGNPNTDLQYTVRLGYDSTAGKAMIYIGELSSVWCYPQVYVTEVLCGFLGCSESWTAGWQISFEASAFKGVTATITDCQVGYRPQNAFSGTKVIGGTTCNFVNGLLVS